MLSNDSKKIVEFISDDKKINDKGFKELKELFNHLKSVNNIHDKMVYHSYRKGYSHAISRFAEC